MQSFPQPFEKILQLLSSMPHRQTALVVLFFVFTIVAGNTVSAMHYRRVGKPVLRSLFNPGSFPLLNYNAREWLLLLGVFALSMGIGVLAVLSG